MVRLALRADETLRVVMVHALGTQRALVPLGTLKHGAVDSAGVGVVALGHALQGKPVALVLHRVIPALREKLLVLRRALAVNMRLEGAATSVVAAPVAAFRALTAFERVIGRVHKGNDGCTAACYRGARKVFLVPRHALQQRHLLLALAQKTW